MQLKRPLLGIVVALTLAGCSSGQGERIPVIPATPTSSVAAAAVSTAAPADITIPKLSAHSTLIPLGLNTDPKLGPVGSVQVPDVHKPLQAGFYARGGVKPGQPGPPLVVVAHINGGGQQGLFARLGDLKSGDTATVKLADGKVLTFRVTSTESDPKDAFPGQKVFGSKDHATLVLATCGGDFDPAKHSYKNNIIVFMDLV
jgi:hypothetical protein